MAGYKRPQRTYILTFDDPEFEGLEVEMKSAPLGVVLQLQSLADKGSDADAVRQMLKIFASRLKSWNLLDDDDKPVPASAKGLETQDIQFLMGLIRAWVAAIAGVSAPLDGGSPSGETSPEASQALASLSKSRAN